MVLYAIARRGVSPVVNAVSTLIVVRAGRADPALGKAAQGMKRRTLFFLGLNGLAGCSGRRALRLNVFNWSNYIGTDTLPHFEARNRHSRPLRDLRKQRGDAGAVMSGNSGWDVVFPSHNFIEPMREHGAARRTAITTRLPNLAHLDALLSSVRPGTRNSPGPFRTCGGQRHPVRRATCSRRPHAGRICGTPRCRAHHDARRPERKFWAQRSRSWDFRLNSTNPDELPPRAGRSTAAKAAAARLPERGGPRPGRGRRRCRVPALGDRRATGHRRGAGTCVSPIRARASRAIADTVAILRESRRAGSGASLPRLPAAPRRRRRHLRGVPHSHRERAGTPAFA